MKVFVIEFILKVLLGSGLLVSALTMAALVLYAKLLPWLPVSINSISH